MTWQEREILWALNRTALIEAHRAKDWPTAKKLSQARERLKKKSRRKCETCGVPISQYAERFCMQHWNLFKFYNRLKA